MAKIINNGKWYTGDEYNETYHDMIFGGGRIVTINVIKVKEEAETYHLADNIAKFIAAKVLGRDIIYLYRGETISREELGIVRYDIADSKYEEVDIREVRFGIQ